jgi:N-methylhydantoinase A/oxoprolinase/acetone carboxylase beta subunit/N-methylhydantoinase B/oxoprolinase/acetone carboxylase alpha subunit
MATAEGTGSVRVGADVGGTFTDVVALRADGQLTFRKVLSTPPDYDRAVIDGLRTLGEDIGGLGQIESVVHATTVATNAVLERRGSRTALVTTAGFRDVLELRRVRVPLLYDTFWAKPPPLVERQLRLEVRERITAGGEVISPLDAEEVRSVAARLRGLEVGSVAVCFLHAHRHPEHEQQAGEILREELPGVPVSLSHEVIREQQEYERSAATAVNAYVRPLMERYVTSIQHGMRDLGINGELTLMQSSGGVMDAAVAAQRPVYVLESGPAAGVVAALALARRHEIENAIAFDMGGTTAKASLIENGRVSWTREYEVGGGLSASHFLRGEGEMIRVPTLDIAEVGAGGGSVAWVDDARGLRVGPVSAGADPGPACYGRGGTRATVTDANVVLGYIPPGRLADGGLTVSVERARAAVGEVAGKIAVDVEEAAKGIHELANAAMMRALRAVSTEKGRDPADFALIAYGGSGPVHAAGLAAELGIDTVLVPPVAGGFSAAGLLFARPEFHDVRFCRIDVRAGDAAELVGLDQEMRTGLLVGLRGDEEVTWRRSADVRYRGQSWDIEVDLPDEQIDAAAMNALAARFEDEHERTYGVREDANAPIEIRALRLAVLGGERADGAGPGDTDAAPRQQSKQRTIDFRDDNGAVSTEVCRRGDVTVDGREGPLAVDEYDTTVVVPPGWHAARAWDGTLRLTRGSDRATDPTLSHGDIITRGIVGNALASIADEMAMSIFRTAHSTIVRDCMDFSASICGPTGETVAQAVTLPVHLGATPPAVAALLQEYGSEMREGDVFIMNDPFSGGMHTPDVFIIKPILLGDTVLGYAVTTAHHADVGGRVVGTASCDNTDIFQEGLRIPWMRLYDAGQPVDPVFKFLRANVHLPATTLGDIRAQMAGCTIGERAVRALAERYTPERLHAIMADLLDYTEELVRRDIARWPDGSATFTDYLDSDGIEERDVAITATVTIHGDEITIDLSDCSPMVRGALNSTRSSAQAAAYHAVMSAVSADLPMTAGAFRPVTVVTKPGTITHVVMPAASSMRGVTSFRVLDAINGALAQLVPDRIPAAGEGGNSLAVFASPGTGGEQSVFYELVVGTWGARPGLDGNDGVSNPCSVAANIPIEVAEADFPVLIERYGFVMDSAGAGHNRGGLAIERSWRTLAADGNLLVRSDRQRHRPYGLSGGHDGTPSENTLIDGERSSVHPPMFSTTIGQGVLFHHRMAGGGGWGDPLTRDPQAVADDVRNEKVSARAALETYGVVVGEDGAVEVAATAQARSGRQSAIESEPSVGPDSVAGVPAEIG